MLTPDRVPAVYAEYGDDLVLTRAGKSGKAGDPNKDARDAIADAEYVRSRPQVAELLDGAQCEAEVCFVLDGIQWVAHIDLATSAGCVCDAKTCADVDGTEWSPVARARIPWHEALLYWHQLATYRRARGAATVPAVALIVCQHCADGVPDVRIIERAAEDDDILDRLAGDVEWSMRHEWTSPLTGRAVPPFANMLDARPDVAAIALPRCGTCPWCRQTRADLYFPYRSRRDAGV